MCGSRYVLVVVCGAILSVLCVTFVAAQVQFLPLPESAGAPTYPSECGNTDRLPPCKDVDACRAAVHNAIQKLRDEKKAVDEYYAGLVKIADQIFASSAFSQNLSAANADLKALREAKDKIAPGKFPNDALDDYVTALFGLSQRRTDPPGVLLPDKDTIDVLKSAESSAEKFKTSQGQAEVVEGLNAVAKRLRDLAANVDGAASKIGGVEAYAKASRTELNETRLKVAAAKTAKIMAQAEACSLGATRDNVEKGFKEQQTTTPGLDGKIIVDVAKYGNVRQAMQGEAEHFCDTGSTTAYMRRMCQYGESKICVNPNNPSQQELVDDDKACPSTYVDAGRSVFARGLAFCAAKVSLSAMCGGRDPYPGERQLGVKYRCSQSWNEYLEAIVSDGEFVYLDCVNAKEPPARATRAAK